MANNRLAPSRSTVYISNIPYDLKNNDIHQLFGKYGKIVKVTIVKDKASRRSKGIAFILFLQEDDAKKCVEATNDKDFFGRTLKASIAKDNGRSTEFIKKRTYPDKSYCYECGEAGHLSYACSANLLGAREPPPKKKRKRKPKLEAVNNQVAHGEDDEDDNNEDDYQDSETLSAAIAAEQAKYDEEVNVLQSTSGGTAIQEPSGRKIKKSSYFSDEEESD